MFLEGQDLVQEEDTTTRESIPLHLIQEEVAVEESTIEEDVIVKPWEIWRKDVVSAVVREVTLKEIAQRQLAEDITSNFIIIFIIIT